MKLRIERDALADAVAWAARTLPARPTNPVLSGILLSAPEGDLVQLSSSDQAVSSQASIEAEVAEPGDVVVSGRLVADIAKSLPPQPVSLMLEGTRLVLQCGRSSFTLPTLPVEDYPALPALPPVLGRVAGEVLADAVGQVAIAASRDDTLPVLTGIRMEFSGSRVTLAATDRYRLAVREFTFQPTDPSLEAQVLVRGKTLSDLTRPLAHAADVDLALDDTHSLIGIIGGSRRSTTPVLDGDFPDYRRLLPSEAAARAEITTADLIESVKRVKLVVERPGAPIQLEFVDGEVLLRAGTGDEAQATEALECSMEGDPISIAFNPDYLLEGLAALDGETARLSMTQPTKPAVVSSAADESGEYRYLLMPIRVPG